MVTNVWIANNGSSTVTELRASDGTPLGTFNTGVGPCGLAFDGVNIWAANAGDGTITDEKHENV